MALEHKKNLNDALIEAIEEKDLQMVKHLIESGADISVYDSVWEESAMGVAILLGQIEIVEELIKCGVDVNTPDNFLYLPSLWQRHRGKV